MSTFSQVCKEAFGAYLTWLLCVYNLCLALCSWFRNRWWPTLAATPLPSWQLAASEPIAVVVPSYNEEKTIAATLRTCAERANNSGEIVFYVVIGVGTHDRTAEVAVKTAKECGVEIHVLNAYAPGRGPPHRVGGLRAARDLPRSPILFLHADVLLPEEWDSHVRKAFLDRKVVGGSFRFGVQPPEPEDLKKFSRMEIFSLAITDWMYGFRVRAINCIEGDHAPFIRSEAYLEIGGHPAWPLLEDLEFQRQCWRLTARGGKLVVIPAETQCDTRRWLSKGVLWITLLNSVVYTLHWVFGISGKSLFRVYYGVDATTMAEKNPLPAKE